MGALSELSGRIRRNAPLQAVPGQFCYEEAGGVHVVVLHDSAKMKIIHRADNQRLRQAIRLDPDIQRGNVAIAGSFAGHAYSHYWGSPVALRYWEFAGHIVIRGRRYVIEWTDGELWTTHHTYEGDSQFAGVGAYLAFVERGHDPRYRFGIGDVPRSTRDGDQVTYGLSALVPLVLPSSAGKVITYERKNWWYASNSDGRIGRTIVGYNPTAHQIAVIVQRHAGAQFTMDELRDELVKAIGCTRAVALDGSDSVFLRYDNQWVVRDNDGYKDCYNGDSVAFYYA